MEKEVSVSPRVNLLENSPAFNRKMSIHISQLLVEDTRNLLSPGRKTPTSGRASIALNSQDLDSSRTVRDFKKGSRIGLPRRSSFAETQTAILREQDSLNESEDLDLDLAKSFASAESITLSKSVGSVPNGGTPTPTSTSTSTSASASASTPTPTPTPNSISYGITEDSNDDEYRQLTRRLTQKLAPIEKNKSVLHLGKHMGLMGIELAKAIEDGHKPEVESPQKKAQAQTVESTQEECVIQEPTVEDQVSAKRLALEKRMKSMKSLSAFLRSSWDQYDFIEMPPPNKDEWRTSMNASSMSCVDVSTESSSELAFPHSDTSSTLSQFDSPGKSSRDSELRRFKLKQLGARRSDMRTESRDSLRLKNEDLKEKFASMEKAARTSLESPAEKETQDKAEDREVREHAEMERERARESRQESEKEEIETFKSDEEFQKMKEKSGALHTLIQTLISPESNMAFIQTFLYTYRYFILPSDLLDILLTKYQLADKDSREQKENRENRENKDFKDLKDEIKVTDSSGERILKILKLWVSGHFYDFPDDSDVMAKLRCHVTNTILSKSAALSSWGKELDYIITDNVILREIVGHSSHSAFVHLMDELTSSLLRSGLLRTHRRGLMSYKNCFVSSEASDWLVSRYKSISPEMSNSLLSKLWEGGFVRHVSKDRNFPFKNGNHLYKLTRKMTRLEDARQMSNEGESKFSTNLCFMDIHPLDFTRQISLIESTLFKSVSPLELINQSWLDEESSTTSNLVKCIEGFNMVSYWVASEVVSTLNFKQRVDVLKRMINIGELCRQVNNFSTMLQVVVGLSLSYVSRLEKTWKALPSKHQMIFDQLVQFSSPQSNYKNYRSHVKRTPPPLVPYIGIYLRDLTFIEDGNPTFLDEEKKIINFEKMSMVANVMSEIRHHQRRTYQFEESPVIRRFILEEIPNLSLTEAELREFSFSCEPPNRRSFQVVRLDTI